MGGKPSKGTPADQRLKANKQPAAKPAPGRAVRPDATKPAFGSPAWDAKYGIKRK